MPNALHKGKKITVASANRASFIDLETRLCFFSRPVAHFAGQVDILCGKDAAIHIVVYCTLAAHNGIFVCAADMVNGLPLQDERSHYAVDSLYLVLVKGDSRPGFMEQDVRFFLRRQGPVNGLLQSAFRAFFAAIAYIWRQAQYMAGFLAVGGTKLLALFAVAAQFARAWQSSLAYVFENAGIAAGAVIELPAITAAFLLLNVPPDLPA